MGESTKVGISASKVVALIGALIAIRESIAYFFLAAGDPLFILWGIIALVIGIFIFISLDIIDFKKFHLPFIWWILLLLGAGLLAIALLATNQYIGCTLILIAALLEFLSEKKTYVASKIVVLIGACIAIYESIMIFLGGASLLWVNAIFAIIFALILILSLWDKVDIKVPFAWWVVLIAGFVIFTWLSIFSGTVIMVGFLLILMVY